jgi:hypothetical protein
MDDRPRHVRVECTRPRALAAALIQSAATRGITMAGDHLVVETSGASEFYHALPVSAQQAQSTLLGIEGLDEDLESVFRYLVG